MKLNADYSSRLVIDTTSLVWQTSPAEGVERRMLERDGNEIARATSIVRYAAGSKFSSHTHDLGEEIFVLEGEFCDENGSYPAGSYLRNPPGSSHAPYSVTGCTIFVKLRHFQLQDSAKIRIDTEHARWYPGMLAGLSVMPLAEFEAEHTALVHWAPGTRFKPHRHFGGEEILVLSGVFEDEFGTYPAGTWLRSPHLSLHTPWSTDGCTILVKTGHLPD